MSNILGLDLATNISGYAILKSNGVLLDAGIIDTSKEEDIIPKAFLFKTWLTNQSFKGYIDKVCVENALTKMGFGSNANTLLKLTQFNILCQYFCWEYFGFMPEGFNVRSARRKFHGKSIKRGTDQKKLMMEDVINRDEKIKEFLFPMKKDPSRYSTKSYDIIDSYVIAWQGLK